MNEKPTMPPSEIEEALAELAGFAELLRSYAVACGGPSPAEDMSADGLHAVSRAMEERVHRVRQFLGLVEQS